MAKNIRFQRTAALSLAVTLLLECSGGLPDWPDPSGGSMGHGGQTNGGARTQDGGRSAGMAGMSQPSEPVSGTAGTDSVATGGTVGSDGGDTNFPGSFPGGAGGAAGAAGGGEAGGGTFGSTGGTVGIGGIIGAGGTVAAGGSHVSGGTTGRGGATGAGGAIGAGGATGSSGSSGGRLASGGTCAGTRQCDSSLDNDCNGSADNQETPCKVCTLGSSRACDTHTEDGAGLCKAGSQACVLSTDHASVAYTICSGSVGPTLEACGPLQADSTSATPDANCNGIAGDGDYKLGGDCATTVTILGNSVHLFSVSHPGTVAVHKCVTPCTNMFTYFAQTCTGFPTSADTIVGYATTNALPKYAALNIPASSCVYDGGTYGPHFDIQAPAQTFYVLP